MLDNLSVHALEHGIQHTLQQHVIVIGGRFGMQDCLALDLDIKEVHIDLPR